jgi:hypothetical protein
MYLSEIIKRAREFLREPVLSIPAKNLSDSFESHTAAALPVSPWVTAGSQAPKVESYTWNAVSVKGLKIQASGCTGVVGYDISSQICDENTPVHVRFTVRRLTQGTTATASNLNIFGINAPAGLHATLPVAPAQLLLRFLGAGTAPAALRYEVQTYSGWTAVTVGAVNTDYQFDFYLYSNTFSVSLNGVPIAYLQRANYPGLYYQNQHGYLYFVGTTTAISEDMYIDDLSSTGVPTVTGSAHYSDEEIGWYANEGVAFLRLELPDTCFAELITSSSTALTTATNYSLPTDFWRIIGATANSRPIFIVPPREHIFAKQNLGTGNYLASSMANWPIGWLMTGKFYLFPTPTSVGSLEIFYIPRMTEMDIYSPETEEPDLPDDLHYLVIDYVVLRGKEKYNDDSRAIRANLQAKIEAVKRKYGVDPGAMQ